MKNREGSYNRSFAAYKINFYVDLVMFTAAQAIARISVPAKLG